MVNHSSYPDLNLKERRDRSLLRGHPWVFSGAIASRSDHLKIGDIVNICDSQGRFLATGYWSDGSIAIKILSFRREKIDQEFWIRALTNAVRLRERLGLFDNQETCAFRLVHGEGDSLPGVIIDLYDKTAVVQLHSVALRPQLEFIVNALSVVLSKRLLGIIDKSIFNTQDNERNGEGSSPNSNLLWGEAGSPIIRENSLNFKVDWKDGQKTGFFLDQRENRELLKRYSAGKDILNTFCYSGAFSIYGLAGGASSVTSLDASKRAIELAEENISLNKFNGSHRAICSDYFTFIKECPDKYDVVILDPPAFAKHRSAVDEAIKGYTNINYYAIKTLRPCGLLMTYSCSQLVGLEVFWRAIQEASNRAGRCVRIVGRMHQSACHPVSIAHPEGDYLKGFLLSVD